jgi:RNA polymerase sigma-70 factor (ECF subfamily)
MQFLAAVGAGDLAQIERLLATDAVLLADGGGKVTSARNPIFGAGRVARFIDGVRRKLPAGMQIVPAYVNGAPGVLVHVNGRLYAAMAVEAAGGQVRRVYNVNNPDKLARLA